MSALYQLLVVDDEAEIRQGMAQFFPWEQVGFELAGTAENGRTAFEFLIHHPVDVVLCDIRMPVMDGLTLASQIREAGMETLVVFFSAHQDFEYARSAMKFGVHHYIVKSAKFPELIQAFQAVSRELDAKIPTRKTEGKPSEGHHERLVAVVINYVKVHLAENPNLENMARHVGWNPDYLGRVFKATTGLCFSDFLIGLRMQKAAEYMNESNLKTYEIGAKVGYYNPKNFTRAFKAFHGVPPRRFRHPEAG